MKKRELVAILEYIGDQEALVRTQMRSLVRLENERDDERMKVGKLEERIAELEKPPAELPVLTARAERLTDEVDIAFGVPIHTGNVDEEIAEAWAAERADPEPSRDTVETKLDEANAANAELKRRVRELESAEGQTVHDLRKQRDAANATIVTLRQARDKATKDVSCLKLDLDRARETIERKDTLIAGLRRELEAVERRDDAIEVETIPHYQKQGGGMAVPEGIHDDDKTANG